MATSYLIGIDWGKKQDHTALAVVQVERPVPALPPPLQDRRRRRPAAVFTVVHIERVPLGTAYQDIVEVVVKLREDPRFRTVLADPLPTVVEDAGGVGSAMSEMLRDQGVMAQDIVTVPGTGATRALDGTYHVAKQRLVLVLRVLAEARPLRLRLGPRLADAPALRRELESFDETFKETGHLTYSARVQEHDDMLLALAYACWWGTTWGAHQAVTVPVLL